MKTILKKFLFYFILIALGSSVLFSNEKVLSDIFPGQSYQIHTSDDPVEALGGSEIYYLENDLVLKLFFLDEPQEKKRFEQEKLALQFAKKHSLPIVSMVESKTIENHSKNYGLIVMTKAEGTSFNKLIKDYAYSFFHKQQKKEVVERAIKKMAKELASMHNIDEPFISKVKSYPDRLMVRDISKHQSQYGLSIDAKKLSSLYSEKKQVFKPDFGLCHMDLHPGNIFYNPQTDTIELIDITTMQTYDTSYDVCNFLLNLKAVSHLYGIKSSIANAWADLFLEEYLQYRDLKEENLSYQNLIMSLELFYAYDAIPMMRPWIQDNLYELIS